MGPRIFVGNLARDVREDDIDHLFEKYGKVLEVTLKNGFGFVEFEDERDAEDAIKGVDGVDLLGNRIRVEMSLGSRGMRGGAGPGAVGRGNRYGPPMRTDNRLIVNNLSSRVSWQDLKDEFRRYGDVTFADAHRMRDGEGVVEFAHRDDMRIAMRKLDGLELRGRRIHVTDGSRGGSRGRSRSWSRSRDDRRSYKQSRSRSRSPRRRSPSPRRSYSRSRSQSPKYNRSPRRNDSPVPRRSVTPHRSASRTPPPPPSTSKSPVTRERSHS
eukprot:Ihof_evm14s38 gene=Ihof_evmTU14s38